MSKAWTPSGTPNNPASRLHAILAEARRRQQESKVREVWAGMFGVDAADTAAVLLVLADLIFLVRDAKQSLAELDADTSLYLRPFGPIEKAFASVNLEVPWKQFRNQVDDSTMLGLEFGAEALTRMRPEPVVEADALEELIDLVEGVFDEVLQADLPQQIKSVIIENLENIRHAVRTYQISGVKGLRAALERGVGSYFVFKTDFEKALEHQPVSRFWEVLGKLNQVVALASNTQRAVEPVAEFLKLVAGD